MTTAHRPTFDPARGRSVQQTGSILHTRMLPAHKKLKLRQRGQGGVAGFDADDSVDTTDLKQRLLQKENEHLKHIGKLQAQEEAVIDEEPNQHLRDKVLEETRDIDASDGSNSEDEREQYEDDSEDESESEDETELLKKELAKIKAEREAARRKEEEEQQRAEQEKREREIAYGNPLLNAGTSEVKRSWMEDTVFKNQAKNGSQSSGGFVNDMIRSDFHRKFMEKYVK